MWRELISARLDNPRFNDPVSADTLHATESEVGMPLPLELERLYSETDGVYATDAYMWVVFPCSNLVKENQYMHTSPQIAFYGRSFADLLFIGRLGNGDLLAYQFDADLRAYRSVGIWDHEDGQYRTMAQTLEEYILFYWHRTAPGFFDLRTALTDHHIDTRSLRTLRDVMIEHHPEFAEEPILQVEQDFPIITLQSTGAEAWSLREKLHSILPAHGFYPVILGGIEDLGRYHEGMEHAQSPLDYLRWGEQSHAETWLGHEPTEMQAAWMARGLARGWNAKTRPLTAEDHQRSLAREPVQYLGLLHTPHSWQSPAYVAYGCSNDQPCAERHVCIHKYWQERYETEIIVLRSDSMVCRVGKPVSTQQETLVIARQHLVYCPDIMMLGYDEVAARLLSAEYWDFWWD